MTLRRTDDGERKIGEDMEVGGEGEGEGVHHLHL